MFAAVKHVALVVPGFATQLFADIPEHNEGEGGSKDRSTGTPIVIEERVAVLIGSRLRLFNIG